MERKCFQSDSEAPGDQQRVNVYGFRHSQLKGQLKFTQENNE